MKRYRNKIAGLISIVLLGLIICHFVMSFLKESKLDLPAYTEYTKGEEKIHAEFYDIDKSCYFKEHIYCLNDEKCCIMVFSKAGELKKVIQLPYIKEKGGNSLYVYKDKLCIKDKKGVLYQYDSFEKYQKIRLDDKGKITRILSDGKEKHSMVKGEFQEVVAYRDGSYYLNEQESDTITVYRKGAKIKTEEVDYEKLVYQRTGRVKTKEGVYRLDTWRHKLIKGKSEVLYQSTGAQFWMLSSRMNTAMLVLFLVISFFGWKKKEDTHGASFM